MTSKNIIGLDSRKSEQLAAQLNNLLANYQVLYMNTRGYHWNIQGKQFFELHAKFEELYVDVQTKVDEIAERILTLGFKPAHSFQQYLTASKIESHLDAHTGEECISGLVDGFSTLLVLQREILEFAGDASDEGTSALMGDYIGEQEKLLWMLNAYNK